MILGNTPKLNIYILNHEQHQINFLQGLLLRHYVIVMLETQDRDTCLFMPRQNVSKHKLIPSSQPAPFIGEVLQSETLYSTCIAKQ